MPRRLVELRDRWLNPPEWVEWVHEPVPGYPKRPVAQLGQRQARDGAERQRLAAVLEDRGERVEPRD